MADTSIQRALAWSQPALHAVDSLSWEKGSDSFDGCEIAVVGNDQRTGASALFMRLPPRKLEEAHGGRPHYHTATVHNLILEGVISSVIGGREYVGKAGDYFRAPAGLAHAGSTVQEAATVFMMTEGEFGLEFADEHEMARAEEPEQTLTWNQPALHSRSALRWEKGSGSFEGGEIAVVGRDESTGSTALFMRLQPRRLEEAHEGRDHYHTATVHNVIIEGVVSSVINGQKYTGKAGDYFRAPAGMAHAGSSVEQAATIFMLTEGEVGLEFANHASS